MSSNIITLFPKSIYVEDNVCMKMLSDFEKNIKLLKNETKRISVLNVDSSHQVNRKIHENAPFCFLAEEIIKHCKEYMKIYGYSEKTYREISLVDMWFNISGKGDFNFPHTHPGSFLSGAYYVKTAPENVLVFSEENKNVYEEPARLNELSAPFFPLPCIPGRLVIFHGNMTHGTPPQPSEGEKIVISFNTVLRK